MYNCNFPFIRSAAKKKRKRKKDNEGERDTLERDSDYKKFEIRRSGKIMIKCRDYGKPHAAMIALIILSLCFCEA